MSSKIFQFFSHLGHIESRSTSHHKLADLSDLEWLLLLVCKLPCHVVLLHHFRLFLCQGLGLLDKLICVHQVGLSKQSVHERLSYVDHASLFGLEFVSEFLDNADVEGGVTLV